MFDSLQNSPWLRRDVDHDPNSVLRVTSWLPLIGSTCFLMPASLAPCDLRDLHPLVRDLGNYWPVADVTVSVATAGFEHRPDVSRGITPSLLVTQSILHIAVI
jgi:hypothetical protein